MLLKQIQVGNDNFAYIIADRSSREAAIIDPSTQPEKILHELKQNNLHAKYLINTHGHADHTSGNSYILEHSQAKLVSANPENNSLQVTDGNTLSLGKLTLQIITTPGHSADSICILIENNLFTGDTLFVEDVGITFSEKDARTEFESLKKLLPLNDAIKVYPGHNYGSKPSSTIGDEKKHNRALQCVMRDDFKQFLVEK